MSWSRDQVNLLIQLYRDNEVLYFIKNKNYKNRNARNQALIAIEQQLQQLRPNTNISEIKLKINALRTNFLAEYRKQQATLKSGAGTEDVYTPTLWYFQNMMFLLDYVAPRQSIENMDDNNSTEDNTEYEGNPEDFIVDPVTGILSPSQVDNESNEYGQSRSTSTPSPSTSYSKRKLKAEHVLQAANNAITEIATTLKGKTQCVKEDEDIFGELVARKLKQVKNPEEKNLIEEEICKILYSHARRNNIQ